MSKLRIKINAEHCKSCNRTTGITSTGLCVVCNQKHSMGSMDGLSAKACPQCEWSGFIAPSGDMGFICPDCGSKLSGTKPEYFYR